MDGISKSNFEILSIPAPCSFGASMFAIDIGLACRRRFNQPAQRNHRNQFFFGLTAVWRVCFAVSPNISKNFFCRRFRFLARSGEFSRQCPDKITVNVNAFFNSGSVLFSDSLQNHRSSRFSELFAVVKAFIVLTSKTLSLKPFCLIKIRRQTICEMPKFLQIVCFSGARRPNLKPCPPSCGANGVRFFLRSSPRFSVRPNFEF